MSQVRSLTPNFTVVALKMWAYKLQNRKISNYRQACAKRSHASIVFTQRSKMGFSLRRGDMLPR